MPTAMPTLVPSLDPSSVHRTSDGTWSPTPAPATADEHEAAAKRLAEALSADANALMREMQQRAQAAGLCKDVVCTLDEVKRRTRRNAQDLGDVCAESDAYGGADDSSADQH